MLPLPVLHLLCKALAAPTWAGDRSILSWVYWLMETTLRLPALVLTHNTPLQPQLQV